MNIFYTDVDPDTAARSLPDKHIVKMPLETVQMLVSVCMRYDAPHRVLTKAGTVHRGGYKHHPCTVWAGDSRANAGWLLAHGLALCEEYTRRYGKVHACEEQLETLRWDLNTVPFDQMDRTPPALAMPDHLKADCPVESYRRCIAAKVMDKPESFVWAKGTDAPSWLDTSLLDVTADAGLRPLMA